MAGRDGRRLAHGRRRPVASGRRSGRAASRSRASAPSPHCRTGRRRSSSSSASSRRSSTRSRPAWRRSLAPKPSSFRSSPGSRSASLRQRFPNARADRPRHAQSAGRDAPRRRRAVQRGCGRGLARPAVRAVPAARLRALDARRDASLRRSARSPAPGRPMSPASSPRWPRPARSAGCRPDLAQAIALETVLGTALDGGDDAARAMDEVARRVASPKGTTEAGLAVLDADWRARPIGRGHDRSRRAPRRRAGRGRAASLPTRPGRPRRVRRSEQGQ